MFDFLNNLLTHFFPPQPQIEEPRINPLREAIAGRQNTSATPEVTDAVKGFLYTNNHNQETLHNSLQDAAILGKRYNSIKSLVEHNANINHQGLFGNTALHWATGNGYCKTVLTLLELNANPNVTNDSGQTPNAYAMECAEQDNQEGIVSPTQNLCIALNNTARDLNLANPNHLEFLNIDGNNQIEALGDVADN